MSFWRNWGFSNRQNQNRNDNEESNRSENQRHYNNSSYSSNHDYSEEDDHYSNAEDQYHTGSNNRGSAKHRSDDYSTNYGANNNFGNSGGRTYSSRCACKKKRKHYC